MEIEENIFKKCIKNDQKLIDYGFTKTEDNFKYNEKFMDDDFEAIINIDSRGKITDKIIDLNLKDEYTAFRIKNSSLGFANAIKEEYIKILEKISKNCFEHEYFLFPQSNRIAKKIKNIYDITPEFLWESTPDAGVFRNRLSHKWFGLIMKIDKSKLIKNDKGPIEILNIKLDLEVSKYLKTKGIYKAYHMNKKNWVSIILDDTLKDDEIFDLLSISYSLTNTKGV